MSKSLTRTFYLIGVGLIVLGGILLAISIPGGTTTVVNGSTTTTPGNPALFGVAIFLMIASGIPMLVAWIGALVKTAQLQRWGWFICLLVFSGITLLIYIIAGPETPPVVQAGMMPPQYPPQPQYPQYPQYPQQQQQYPPQQQYPQQNYPYGGDQPPYGATPQSPYTSYPPNDQPPPPYRQG